MRHFKELAILAIAGTSLARVLPRDDDDDSYEPEYKAPAVTKAPAPTNVWVDNNYCKPTYEAYICDDEDGKGEYKTTFTIYPTGCPKYTKEPWNVIGGPKSWYNVPVKPTDPWAPAPVKPTKTPDPWAPVDPWVSWGVSKEEYDWWVEDGKKGWPGKPYEPAKGTKPPKAPVPSGWGDWNKWVAPKPTDPAKWDGWSPYTKVDGKTVVIITKTETYYVPCSTGWEAKSTVWYTEHCGCTASPVPVKPVYVTLTTTCPESWGVGKTVVYSTPDCTYTPVAPTPVKPVDAYSTWVATPVNAASTWAVTPVKDASTWAATPVAAASTWSNVSPAAATGTWSPVGVWKGAASSNTISQLMVVGAGAVAGLAYLL